MLIVKSMKPGNGRVILRPYLGKLETQVKSEKSVLWSPTQQNAARASVGTVLEISQDEKDGERYFFDTKGHKLPVFFKRGDKVLIGANTQTALIVDGEELWETYIENVKAVLEAEEVDDETYEADLREKRLGNENPKAKKKAKA